MKRILFLLVCLLAIAQPASAWGRKGHAAVAEIAEANLTPAEYAQFKAWIWPKGMKTTGAPMPSDTITFGEKILGSPHVHMDFYQSLGNDIQEIDHGKHNDGAKRGGGATQVTLAEVAASEGPPVDMEATSVDALDLDEALTRFAALDPDKARLVELRYFAGLSIPEAAAALGVSRATVGREWAVARAWLRRELSR